MRTCKEYVLGPMYPTFAENVAGAKKVCTIDQDLRSADI